MLDRSVEALIVGAGPVGLTMAAALTHRGLACRIIDKAPAPSDKSKALVVWSRTMELLDGLGLADTFVRTGMKIHGATMYGDGGKRLVHVAIADLASPFGFPLMIPQNETERLLTEHLAQRGVTVDRRVELVAFDERPDAVVATVRHADGRDEAITTPWLVGCDGAHSAVRHILGMPFTGHAEPNDWILADTHVAGPLSSDEVSIFWHQKGVLAFFPIDRDRFRMLADIGTASADAPPPDPTLAEAQAQVDERGPGGLTLSAPIWIANFRINERKVSDYRRGRVMLAGDAAHIHSPAGGQGMNTGMQDAFNLAWKLALVQRGHGQAEPLLGSYSVERSAVGDQVLGDAEKMTTLATLRNPLAQALRNHIAPLLTSFGFVQDKLKNAMCELSINYRHSPLVAGTWPALTGGIEPGDRLPDAPLAGPDGSRTTLFAAIRGDGHALLLLPGSDVPALLRIADEVERAFPGMVSAHVIARTALAADSSVPVWLDPEGRVHELLHATRPTLILVRPDGYVGYRSQPADGGALVQYLGRYLVRH